MAAAAAAQLRTVCESVRRSRWNGHRERDEELGRISVSVIAEYHNWKEYLLREKAVLKRIIVVPSAI